MKDRARFLVTIPCFAIVIFCGSSHSGEIYKWIDRDGVTHYGDTRPSETRSEQVTISPTNIASEPQATPSNLSKSLTAVRVTSATTTGVPREEINGDTHQDQKCKEAREQLKTLQTPLPTYRDENGRFNNSAHWILDPYEGKREYLDDVSRMEALAISKARTQELCRTSKDMSPENTAEKDWQRTQECKIAKSELALISKPSTRASPQEIAAKKGEVDLRCSKY